MKTGLNRTAFIEGSLSPVMLDVWDIATNKVVYTGAAKGVAKYIGCKITNVASNLRTGATCQKKYKIKHHSEKTT
jgi:hypothetical protein